ncbi:uncharacterized protein MELLADRAFT_91529 [Melampsora larici-populina 98AG31]|uniref:Uncharacterized protein n=1 Tax=Melampsora larici-populina (strain 98AG31 / pathotype 3-4-7) TaxID=747676 RepID=F4RZD8_MELLP|nr:uncharacterized protein MELLADRAFT_91529 [Melampsora larici-populina 98AG31]EGG02209.1 hypothetical protein MELLADRAFT_91529 [Melampsora larici-populina 98AG31]
MTINIQPLIRKNLSLSSRLSLAFLFLSFTCLVTNSPIPSVLSSVGDLGQLGGNLAKGADNVAAGGVDTAKLTKNLGSVKSTSALDDVADIKNVDSISDASKLKELRKSDLGDTPKFPDTVVKKTTELPETPQKISTRVDDLEAETARLVEDTAKKSRGYITLGVVKIVRSNPGLQTTLEKIYMAPRKIKMALNALKIDRGKKEALILQMSGNGGEALQQLNRVEGIIAKNRVLRMQWADKIGRAYNIKHGSRFRWYKYIKFFGKRGKQYDNIIKNFKNGEETPGLLEAANKIRAKNAVKVANAENSLKAKEARQLRMKNYRANHPGMAKSFNRISRQWKAFKDKLDFAKGKYHVKQPSENPSTAADIGQQTQNVGADPTRMQSGTDLAHSTQVSPGVTSSSHSIYKTNNPLRLANFLAL